MENFLAFFHNNFTSLLPSIYGWLTIIGILLILLVCFRCFSLPFNVSFSKMRKVKSIVSRAAGRKECVFSVFEKTRLKKHLVYSERLVEASLYEDPSQSDLKEANDILGKILLLLDAYDKSVMKEKERTRKLVIKSIQKHVDSYLALPRARKYSNRF